MHHWPVWRSGSVVRRMNEVALRWARLGAMAPKLNNFSKKILHKVLGGLVREGKELQWNCVLILVGK